MNRENTYTLVQSQMLKMPKEKIFTLFHITIYFKSLVRYLRPTLYRRYVRDVKVIPWELQHWLVVVYLDKQVLKRIVKKERIIGKIWKLNENRTRVKFEKIVEELPVIIKNRRP